MALLTTFCKECVRIALLDERRAEHGQLVCPSCGAAVAIVPGCSFSAEDYSLFEDLLQVVAERTVNRAESSALGADIARALQGNIDTHALLERLTARLPGLWPTQAVAGKNEQARRRALRLLRAIFEAKALQND